MNNLYFTSLKKRLIIILLGSLGCIFSDLPLSAQYNPGLNRITVPVNTGGGTDSAFLYLPLDYNQTSTQYPLLVFFHGIGERFSPLNNLFAQGIPKRLGNGGKMEFINPVDGKLYKFIVVCPQEPSGWMGDGEINMMLSFIKQKFRVDLNRIYLTGLSAGGWAVWNYLTANSANDANIAAVAPISAAPVNADSVKNFVYESNQSVYAWAQCGTLDAFYSPNQSYIGILNGLKPGLAFFTPWPNEGHSGTIWDSVYDVYNAPSNSDTLYKWLLAHTRTGSQTPALPVANAGGNQTITLPVDSVALDGSLSTAPGGAITSYLWTQTSGPSQGTILSSGSAKTEVTNLKAGTYIFQLKITDNNGNIGQSSVTISVNSAQPPSRPVANAGYNQTITLPTDSVVLNASGSSSPGAAIVKYQWWKYSGPSTAYIRNSTGMNTVVNGLAAGNYIFALAVTSSNGLQDTAYVNVTVNSLSLSVRTKIIIGVNNQNNSIWYPNLDSAFNIQPGDTICIPAGTYSNIFLGNIQGTPANPVVIQNCGGIVKVGVNNSGGYSFIVSNGKYLILTGTGTPGIEYGFDLAGTLNNGVVVAGMAFNDGCTSVNTHNLYIHDCAEGFVAISRPSCDKLQLTRENYVMKDFKVHHMKIRRTAYEGFYIGSTRAQEVNTTCGDTLNDPLLENIDIYDNDLDTIGYDGIQLSLAYLGTNRIHHNIVRNAGYNKAFGQGMGIIIGGGTKADIYDNYIEDSHLLGVQILGSGLTRFYNNVIVNTYGGDAIQAGDRSFFDPLTVYVFNNTIVNTVETAQAQALTLYNQYSNIDNLIYNNLVVNAPNSASRPQQGYYIDPTKPIKYQFSNNIYLDSISQAGFVSPSTYNFMLNASSPAVDRGRDLSSYGVTTDILGNKRPVGASFDAGAYEYGGGITGNNAPVADAGPDRIVYLPTDSSTLDGSASFDPGGSILKYKWTVLSGPNQPTIVGTADSLTTIANLVQGDYIFQLTVTNNGGITATDLVKVKVFASSTRSLPPVANAGPNIVVNPPSNQTTLNGSASYDSTGSIVIYRWTKVSGPKQGGGSMDYPDASIVNITNLSAGVYVYKLTVTNDRGLSASASVTVTVNGPNGKNKKKDTFLIYPNPASNTVYLQSNSGEQGIIMISFVDISGRVLKTVELTKNQGFIIQPIDISGLPSGIYFVNLRLSDLSSTQKLVKL